MTNLMQILIKKFWRSFAWGKGARPGRTTNHATNHASQAEYLTNHAGHFVVVVAIAVLVVFVVIAVGLLQRCGHRVFDGMVSLNYEFHKLAR